MQYRSLRPYKYQTVKPYKHPTLIPIKEDIETDYTKMSRFGVLTVKKGYAWDGATYFPDIKSVMMPSLIHDSLTQLMHEKILPMHLRKKADLVFKEHCIDEGMPKFLANSIYFVLRVYGRIRYGV